MASSRPAPTSLAGAPPGSLGVGPEVLVGLCVEPVAGDGGRPPRRCSRRAGAYLPIDPALPRGADLGFMLEDARRRRCSSPKLALREQIARLGDVATWSLPRRRTGITIARRTRAGRVSGGRRPGGGEPRLRHLHLGLDRPAQGGAGHPRRPGQLPAIDEEADRAWATSPTSCSP